MYALIDVVIYLFGSVCLSVFMYVVCSFDISVFLCVFR